LLNNYGDLTFSSSLTQFIYLFGCYFVFKQFLIGSPKVLRGINIILIFCFSTYTLHGFLQYYDFLPQSSSLNKVSGFYSNPAPFAGLLISLIGFPFFKLIGNQKIVKSIYHSAIEYLLFILILIGIVTIIFTKSRAAFVALLFGCFFVLIIHKKWIYKIKEKFKISIKKLFLFASLSLVTFSSILYFLRPDSAYGRLVIWKISLIEMFPEKLFFGHGDTAFQKYYMSYQAQYFKENLSNIGENFSVANTPYAFNEFIKILIEEGLIGFLLFITLIGILIFLGFGRLRINKDEASNELLGGALISLIAITVFSNFSYPFYDITFQTIFYFIIAIISSQIPSLKNFKLPPVFSLSSTVIILGILFLSFQKHYEKYNAYNIWRENSSFNRDIGELEKIKHFFKKQGLFYIDYADALYEDGRKKEAIQILEVGKIHTSNPTLYMKLGRYYDEGVNDVKKAELAYKQASFSIPYKFYPKYRLLKMYERNNLKNKSYAIAKEIIAMPIKVNSEALQNMKNHANRIVKDYHNKSTSNN
jgi:O-antigen polymerase